MKKKTASKKRAPRLMTISIHGPQVTLDAQFSGDMLIKLATNYLARMATTSAAPTNAAGEHDFDVVQRVIESETQPTVLRAFIAAANDRLAKIDPASAPGSDTMVS